MGGEAEKVDKIMHGMEDSGTEDGGRKEKEQFHGLRNREGRGFHPLEQWEDLSLMQDDFHPWLPGPRSSPDPGECSSDFQD